MTIASKLPERFMGVTWALEACSSALALFLKPAFRRAILQLLLTYLTELGSGFFLLLLGKLSGLGITVTLSELSAGTGMKLGPASLTAALLLSTTCETLFALIW